MGDVGVVLKVPHATHARFKEACAKHDRSMQKVLLGLIEGWVAHGAPDPSTYGRKSDASQQHSTQDPKARQAILNLASELKKMQARLAALENSTQPPSEARPDFEAFYDALQQAAQDEATQPLGM